MRLRLATLLAVLFVSAAATAAPLDLQAVNDAQWGSSARTKGRIAPALVKAQVLLDRARFSPGEIDGKPGDNFKKALIAFAAARGLQSKADMTKEVWQELAATSSDPVLKEYTVSDEDVGGPFTENIPASLEKKKELPALGYTSTREKIAEKFHMSQELLQALNPGKKFETAEEKIVVANVAAADLPEKAARLEIDKSARVLKVFGRDQKLLAMFPVTVGSAEKPAPSGQLKITGISKNPTYRYNPKYAFKGVRATEPFTINPGPNNPVGVVWIGLSAEGYGIHGTPDPSKISKSESHGCIRLTNWDALRLAAGVAKGIPVDFTGDQKASRKGRPEASLAR